MENFVNFIETFKCGHAWFDENCAHWSYSYWNEGASMRKSVGGVVVEKLLYTTPELCLAFFKENYLRPS
jgi:hypothetical protein